MEMDLCEKNVEEQEIKSEDKSLKCAHCSKPISKRSIKEHEAKCTAANMALPNGFKAETVDGRLQYFCSCGYKGKKYLVLKHIIKCQIKKQASTSNLSTVSVSELQNFQETGRIIPVPDSEIVPVIVEPIQSVSMAIQEMEFEEDSNCKNFDYSIHPKFAQFKQPKEDAPVTNMENRLKIFTISLLLRFTGYFDRAKRAWEQGRHRNINTQRFLVQLNSYNSVFKGSFRNLCNLQADLKDVAVVDQNEIFVPNHEALVHQLKQALQNYKYAAIWHVAHATPMVEKKRKRAPRAHWETRKMRKYIANVKYRNKRWGWKLRPLTTLQMRERSVYCQQVDLMYKMKYHMSRPIPRYHKKQHLAKKDELMINYAIHRIADAFTADFYVDYIRFEMKVVEGDEGSGFENGHTVNIFQCEKSYQAWKKKVAKQLPTTTIWLGVSRFYLDQRKSLMSATYYSCQDRFRRPMPRKTEQEIYQLTIKWYKENYLIDDDDWPEMKRCFEDKINYEKKIQEQVKRVQSPEYVIKWSDMIDDKPPESPPEEEIEVRIALPKPIKRVFLPKYNVFAFTQEQILQKDAKFELRNKPKAFDVMDFQKCCKMACPSWLKDQVLDCAVCHATYHSYCWPKNDRCDVCQLSNDSMGYSSDLPKSVKKVLLVFPVRKKFLVTPQKVLFPEGEQAAIKNVEQNLLKQQYCVYNVFHEWFTLYPFYNQNLMRLDPADEEIIDRYARKEQAFPVVVNEISKVKGKGLVARRPIKNGELVATYSGNVMALSQVAKYGDKIINQYTFDLIYGPDVMSNYAVYPKDYASAGFFMNHANSNTNVFTEVVLTKNGPLILMLASKEINYGKELVYNYNGCVNMYNTDDFV